MATKTYVRTGQIQWPMSDDEQAMYAEADGTAQGDTFMAELDEPTETWLIGNGVIALPTDLTVTLPFDGPSAGDLPTADGSGDYAWEAPA